MKQARFSFVARPRPGGLFRDLLGVGSGMWATASHIIETPAPPLEPTLGLGALHLRLGDDGTVLCVGCGLCANVCPPRCLTVERDLAVVQPGSRPRPARFEVDELRCISCARCVEICPEDALEFTSTLPSPVSTRHQGIKALFPLSRAVIKTGA